MEKQTQSYDSEEFRAEGPAPALHPCDVHRVCSSQFAAAADMGPLAGPRFDSERGEARRGKKDSGGCACACLGRAMQSGASGLLLSIFLGRIDNN